MGPPSPPQAYLLRVPSPEGAPSFQILLCQVFFCCFKSACKSNRGPKHIWTPWAWATLVTSVKLVIQHWNHLSIKTNSTGPIGSFNCEVQLYTYIWDKWNSFFFLNKFFFLLFGAPLLERALSTCLHCLLHNPAPLCCHHCASWHMSWFWSPSSARVEWGF